MYILTFNNIYTNLYGECILSRNSIKKMMDTIKCEYDFVDTKLNSVVVIKFADKKERDFIYKLMLLKELENKLTIKENYRLFPCSLDLESLDCLDSKLYELYAVGGGTLFAYSYSQTAQFYKDLCALQCVYRYKIDILEAELKLSSLSKKERELKDIELVKSKALLDVINENIKASCRELINLVEAFYGDNELGVYILWKVMKYKDRTIIKHLGISQKELNELKEKVSEEEFKSIEKFA